MYVNPKTNRTATLYGKDTAMQPGERGDAGPATPHSYPAGAVLALVTWAQRNDPHWFGGRIPDTPVTVEFVQVSSVGSSVYRVFEGRPLIEAHPDPKDATQRAEFILNLKAVILP